mmetsp:Transcript_10946/g.22967  ORF Transcript_10946/g.22967 Transcript_10946/m.22967 type:complete len:223 (+) Transcript_10946:104-772(+)
MRSTPDSAEHPLCLAQTSRPGGQRSLAKPSAVRYESGPAPVHESRPHELRLKAAPREVRSEGLHLPEIRGTTSLREGARAIEDEKNTIEVALCTDGKMLRTRSKESHSQERTECLVGDKEWSALLLDSLFRPQGMQSEDSDSEEEDTEHDRKAYVKECKQVLLALLPKPTKTKPMTQCVSEPISATQIASDAAISPKAPATPPAGPPPRHRCPCHRRFATAN